jgi:hypothetical protein
MYRCVLLFWTTAIRVPDRTPLQSTLSLVFPFLIVTKPLLQ